MAIRALFDVAAPAKLNLFLHVVGRRADGFHLLQSVFLLIDWCDTLHFERRSDGHLARHDLSAALPADDLCLRAAHALRDLSGTTQGADISIDKQLPWGAGMGGGSSDAASTLLALNRLWGLDLPLPALMRLGLGLGADIPFFLGGHNAFVEGIGERLTPLALPRQWLAVLKPAENVQTQGIFESPLLVRNTEPVILEGLIEDACGSQERNFQRIMNGHGRNDLQPPAQQICPEIARAAKLLDATYGNSRMTGSGSAVFARNGMHDQSLVTWPAEPLPPGWMGRMCRSLDQHPLLDWTG